MYAHDLGYLPQNGGRRARELCASGKIKKEERPTKDGYKVTWYRYTPSIYEIMDNRMKTGQITQPKLI